MIDRLTPEQEAQFSTYRDKWLKIGLSTEPVNIEKALKAIERVYAAARPTPLPVPEKYEIYDSPLEAIQEMKVRYNIDVGYNDFIYGAHDAAWLSHYDYMLNVVGIEECAELQGLMDLATCSGWVLPFDELVVFTHNPCEIHFDDMNRTHYDRDYAIKFRDGTGVAVWHGVTIPEAWVFDRSTITPDVLLHHENVEQRRAACEMVGWANVLKLLDARLIDQDPDETIGVLVEVDFPNGQESEVGAGTSKEKFLIAKDPNTDTLVGLPVPPEVQTALEANSWTYGIDRYEFKPDFRV